MADAPIRALLLFASDDGSIAEPLAARLEREGITVSARPIPPEDVDPAQFGASLRGLDVVGLLIGRAGVPSWLLSVVANAVSPVPFVAIWLPTNRDDTMVSWPPEARSVASFDLSKAGQDEREVAALAAQLRSVAAAPKFVESPESPVEKSSYPPPDPRLDSLLPDPVSPSVAF
ncbi:MAG TPA: hypothetical protein VFO05_03615, partial [Candidatus Limnocylindrales bacterium]|nr:hypothetical protein [Candidatus Limnocylindrales bacterium]